MKKHSGRNLVAIVLAGVVIKLLTEIMHLSITEVLKEN